MRTTIRTVWLFVWLNIDLAGQSRPSFETLLANEAKIDVTWSIDKTQYFIGEEIIATVALTNPTNSPIVVADPFSVEARFFELAIVSQDGKTLHRFPHIPQSAKVRERLPLRTIGPGENATWSGRSGFTDTQLGDGGPFGFPAVPDYPAKYDIYFTFGRGYHRGKSFRAVTGVIDAAFPVRYRPSATTPGRPDFWVFAIRRAEASFLCVTVDPVFAHKSVFTGRQLQLPSGQVAPFRRIAESPNPITYISATPSPDGSASIIFTDSTGNQRRVNIDANRMPLTP